jgi:hypothetical protein
MSDNLDHTTYYPISYVPRIRPATIAELYPMPTPLGTPNSSTDCLCECPTPHPGFSCLSVENLLRIPTYFIDDDEDDGTAPSPLRTEPVKNYRPTSLDFKRYSSGRGTGMALSFSGTKSMEPEPIDDIMDFIMMGPSKREKKEKAKKDKIAQEKRRVRKEKREKKDKRAKKATEKTPLPATSLAAWVPKPAALATIDEQSESSDIDDSETEVETEVEDLED